VHKGMGMISNVFSDDSMKKLKGKVELWIILACKSDITRIQEIKVQGKAIKIALI
jgi:glutamine phosphoribosylpyrophosphate amidotransferase